AERRSGVSLPKKASASSMAARACATSPALTISNSGAAARRAARRSASIAGWITSLKFVGIPLDSEVGAASRAALVQQVRLGSPALLPLVHQLSAQVGKQTLGILDVVNWTGEEVPIDDDEVGQLALLERADLVLQEHEVSVIDGVEAESLFAAEGLLGV